MADSSLNINDPDIMVSPSTMAMAKVVATMKDREGKDVSLSLQDIYKRVEAKYKPMTKEEYTNEIEPFILIATFMLTSMGYAAHDQIALMSFVKGFIFGQVFGKNAMEVSVEKQDLEEGEYRTYIASKIKLSAQRATAFANKLEEGVEDIRLLEATLFGE